MIMKMSSACNSSICIWLGTDHLTCRRGGDYVFSFRSEICFRTARELEYLFYLSREARIFFQVFNIRLYDKNSESNYFCFLHHNQNIFSVTLGIRICFLDERTSVLGFKFTKCFDLQRFVFLIVVKLTEEIMFN